MLQWASGGEEKREKERGREKEGAQSSETREAAAMGMRGKPLQPRGSAEHSKHTDPYRNK